MKLVNSINLIKLSVFSKSKFNECTLKKCLKGSQNSKYSSLTIIEYVKNNGIIKRKG